MLNQKYPERWFRHLISLPFILMMIIPIIILDVWTEIYHRICFPLYGIPFVSRKKYIKIDRHKLSYLTWYQKIGCAYCGYANGGVAYIKEIAGRTEAYWCGIKHKKDRENYCEPEHHATFVEYNNMEEHKAKYSPEK
ncbi:hypothetical protein ACFL1U_00365 [Patescibacteria group bacterium]